MKKEKKLQPMVLLIIITSIVGMLSAIINITEIITIIVGICILLLILFLVAFLIIKKYNKHSLTDEDKKWNKMIDLWVEEKLDSPYAELMTYYQEVFNGGHLQYFSNVNNSNNLKKEMSLIKKLLPPEMYDNLNKAYKAELRLEKKLNLKETASEEELNAETDILEECDNIFFANEQLITEILEEYALKMEL